MPSIQRKQDPLITWQERHSQRQRRTRRWWRSWRCIKCRNSSNSKTRKRRVANIGYNGRGRGNALIESARRVPLVEQVCCTTNSPLFPKVLWEGSWRIQGQNWSALIIHVEVLNEFLCFNIHNVYVSSVSSKSGGLSKLLKEYGPALNTCVRLAACKALVIIRNRGLVSATDLIYLFLQLLRCQDKGLRIFLRNHIITDIKNMNAKVNSHLQGFMYSMLDNTTRETCSRCPLGEGDGSQETCKAETARKSGETKENWRGGRLGLFITNPYWRRVPCYEKEPDQKTSGSHSSSKK